MGMTVEFEGFRRELTAHCYRMVGSVDEAEDLVQETYLRAWKGVGGFRGEASMRVWLYRIATNVCLTALRGRGRRAVPSGLAAASTDPYGEPVIAEDALWVQPVPDELVTDPASIVADRESLRLALIASLQYLPARQRAVLILREVLAFSAQETAEMLDTSVTAVKSMLQRARATLEKVEPAHLEEPTEPDQKRLLGQYIAAFETSDLSILERVLRKDASLEMIGSTTWFAGNDTCLPYLATVLGAPGDWRMTPIHANGQPAVKTYYQGEPFGVALLTLAGTGIKSITVFADPALMSRFP